MNKDRFVLRRGSFLASVAAAVLALAPPDSSAGLACSATPQPGCREARRTSLRIRDRSNDASDRLVWAWTKGDATDRSAFGDPLVGTTQYAVCLYDSSAGAAQLVMNATIGPGGACGTSACWRTLGSNGFRYGDSSGAVLGVTKMLLRAGEEGRAKITLKAKGSNLALPAPAGPNDLLRQDPYVVVQLVNSEGSCWESLFPAPAFDAGAQVFKDEVEGEVPCPPAYDCTGEECQFRPCVVRADCPPGSQCVHTGAAAEGVCLCQGCGSWDCPLGCTVGGIFSGCLCENEADCAPEDDVCYLGICS
jgi:hypothetical protein